MQSGASRVDAARARPCSTMADLTDLLVMIFPMKYTAIPHLKCISFVTRVPNPNTLPGSCYAHVKTLQLSLEYCRKTFHVIGDCNLRGAGGFKESLPVRLECWRIREEVVEEDLTNISEPIP